MSAPAHTCPGIDRAIRTARQIQRRVGDVCDRLDALVGAVPAPALRELRTAFARLNAALAQLVADLDRVREENTAMRAWGAGMERGGER